MAPNSPISSVIPPLIFGTATFNYQYNDDPFKLPTTAIVHEALSLGVGAFDTSPYYGPSEEILGKALYHPYEQTNKPYPREKTFLITKVGRIASNKFDYSPEWVRKSIGRSLERLRTPYLDLVYCHDVEFVSPAEVLGAIKELRRIRDTDETIKYVGISGYPVTVLCDLAEMVLKETGEPLDAVQSYANYTLQNRLLLSHGIERLKKAGVQAVPNASILGMGLLRKQGVPVGEMGDWHPAPDALRQAAREASDLCDKSGETLAVVAIRWALETWAKAAESVGSRGDPASGLQRKHESIDELGPKRLGISVMGVSSLSELEETMRVWRSILDGLEGENKTESHEWSLKRRNEIEGLAKGVQHVLGKWLDFAWESPDEGFKKAMQEKSAPLDSKP
jgi:D-arabinose 1-dehydrogenase